MKSAKALAMAGGRRGRARRVTTSTPASFRGTGRNSAAGIRRPRRNSYHGAHTVDSNVDGGTVARSQATSHCTITSARSRGTLGSSRRRRKMSVVRPKGTDPTTLIPRRASASVTAPEPAPTSMTRLCGRKSASATRRSAASGQGSSDRAGDVARPEGSARRRTPRITTTAMTETHRAWGRRTIELSGIGALVRLTRLESGTFGELSTLAS